MLLYHHRTNLESVVFGELKADPKYSDPDGAIPDPRGAYSWLEKQVGFYPLHIAIGSTEDEIRITGYQIQWAKLLSKGTDGNEYRKKGEFPNYVLFSFEDVDGKYMDWAWWSNVILAQNKNYDLNDYEKKLIFKKSWSRSKWLKAAKENLNIVQLVTPSLYLPDAKRIWVRNKKSKKYLESMGFENVEVKRLHLNES